MISIDRNFLKDEIDLNILLNAVNTIDYRSEYKRVLEYTIIKMFVLTRIRNSELCRLNLNDIDFENNSITIKYNTASKDRELELTNELKTALKEYLNIRNNLQIFESEAVFLTQGGNRIQELNITRRFLRLSNIIGIYVSPYRFRKLFYKI